MGGIPFARSPLWHIKRLIDESKAISPRVKSHVLLWAEDIRELCTEDQRHQSIASQAILAYLQCARLQEQAINGSLDTAKAERQARLAMAWGTHLSKLLRLAGLRAKALTGHQKARGAPVFTPPPNDPPSRIQAEIISDNDTKDESDTNDGEVGASDDSFV